MAGVAEAPKNRKVVIDAGAAIRLQRLDRLGDELFSTSGVLREIKDEHARALLATLPVEVQPREPRTEDVNFVKQFAAKTGDLGFLSSNDVELIALTLALHREAGGEVRQEPSLLETVKDQVNFAWGPEKAEKGEAEAAEGEESATAEPAKEPAQDTQGEESATGEPAEAVTAQKEADAALNETPGADGEDSGADSDGSSAGEWVTVENIHRCGLGVRAADLDGSNIRVACATRDYSVQNVLLQMGLVPLTFDGFAVRSVKIWGLICRACYTFTRDTTKMFCPKCGNDTVQRVPITVGEDGQPKVIDNRRRRNLKGSIYSIPKARGGRGWKPIFAEDELKLGGRDRELRHLEKVYEKERQMKDPFNEDNGARGWWQRSTTSTGKGIRGYEAPRVQVGYGRKNPNANNFRFKNKKK